LRRNAAYRFNFESRGIAFQNDVGTGTLQSFAQMITRRSFPGQQRYRFTVITHWHVYPNIS
jgi:hypothetical protein